MRPKYIKPGQWWYEITRVGGGRMIMRIYEAQSDGSDSKIEDYPYHDCEAGKEKVKQHNGWK